MKTKFNQYCAEVMGYSANPSWKYDPRTESEYNPYDDLNQIAEVVEKLVIKYTCSAIKSFTPEAKYGCKVYSSWSKTLKSMRNGAPIKQSFRDFIISTMEKENELIEKIKKGFPEISNDKVLWLIWTCEPYYSKKHYDKAVKAVEKEAFSYDTYDTRQKNLVINAINKLRGSDE